MCLVHLKIISKAGQRRVNEGRLTADIVRAVIENGTMLNLKAIVWTLPFTLKKFVELCTERHDLTKV